MDDDVGDVYLEPCHICGRKFRPDVLGRHQPICQKSTRKKRGVFESGKQRASGSDVSIDKVLRVNKPPPKDPPKVAAIANKKNNWRQKHEEFIRNIRAARQYKNAAETGGPLPPPPPPTINPDFIQCDYCGRRFNEKAADRHIPFCRDKNSRVSGPGRVVTRENPYNTSDAKQKMAVRTQYQAPKPRAVRGGGAGGGRGPSAGSEDRSPSGAPLRTGKTMKDYMDARELAAESRGNSGGSGTRAGVRQQPRAGAAGSNGTSSGYGARPPSYGARGGGAGGGGGGGGYGGGLSKFCHECGNKYPTGTAKFCVECGCRRMAVA